MQLSANLGMHSVLEKAIRYGIVGAARSAPPCNEATSGQEMFPSLE